MYTAALLTIYNRVDSEQRRESGIRDRTLVDLHLYWNKWVSVVIEIGICDTTLIDLY